MRKLSRDKAQLTAKLLTNCFWTGAELLSKNLLGDSPAAPIVSTTLGIAKSAFGDHLTKGLVSRLARPDTPPEIHDLNRAIGMAIKTALHRGAPLESEADQAVLIALADAAPICWSGMAEGEKRELAAEVTEYFAIRVNETGAATALSPELWGEFLTAVASEAEVDMSAELMARLAARLHQEFGEALRRILLEDTGTGGTSYASLTLMLMGEIAAQVRSGQAEDRQRHEELLARLDELHAALRASSDLPLIDGSEARAPDRQRNNLPQQLTSFVGREREVAELREMLSAPDGGRLVTLVGIGGTGKTRLALHAAEALLDGEGDGVWLVELAPLSDAALIAQTIASALGVHEETGQTPLQSLIASLKPKRLLLLLDNCEHLIAGCARLADALLRQCPGVRILATSREGLNISGERIYRVHPLPLPDPGPLPATVELGQCAAIRLFVERAAVARSGFTLTEENARSVIGICRHLDGLPLAIELAAARTRAMPIEQLESRLNDRFRLLTGGSRTALPHQQTLRALIDWSYDLLRENEQALLRRCAVFAGGWSLEAVEQVCAGEDIEAWEMLDLLTVLADKSLILYEEFGAESRYRMLETLRQYAAEKLSADPANAGFWRRRHCRYFVRLAEEGHPHFGGQGQGPWLERFESESDNFRQALYACYQAGWQTADDGTETAANSEDEGAENALRLVRGLQPFWMARGYLSEGRSLSEQALSQPGMCPRTGCYGDVCDGAGTLARMQGDSAEAIRRFTQSLEIRRQLNNTDGIARSLNNLGTVARQMGDYEAAQRWLEESLALHRSLGNGSGIANVLQDLGNLSYDRNDQDAAARCYEEALRLRRAAGETNLIGLLSNLGVIAQDRGDYEIAHRNYQECLQLAQKNKDRFAISILLHQMGNLAYTRGEPLQAIGFLEEGLALSTELGDQYGVALAHQTLGQARQALGEYALAGRLLRDAIGLHQALGNRRDIAFALEKLASLMCAQNAMEQAVRLYSAADALRRTLGIPCVAEARARQERELAKIRAEIGEDAWAAAWEEGQAMTYEEAIACAQEFTL